MLIQSQAGLVAVRRRLVAPRFGHAVSNPLSGGMTIGFTAVGALACHPKVDDFSHAKARRLLFSRSAFGLIIQVPKTSGELHAIYLIISQFKRKTKLKYKQHAPTLFPEDGYLKKCFFQ
jgi:hypothetical protein